MTTPHEMLPQTLKKLQEGLDESYRRLMATVTTEQKLACAKRELAMRKRVYPGQVERGKMKQSDADRETLTMTAIIADYENAAFLEQLASPKQRFQMAIDAISQSEMITQNITLQLAAAISDRYSLDDRNDMSNRATAAAISEEIRNLTGNVPDFDVDEKARALAHEICASECFAFTGKDMKHSDRCDMAYELIRRAFRVVPT